MTIDEIIIKLAALFVILVLIALMLTLIFAIIHSIADEYRDRKGRRLRIYEKGYQNGMRDASQHKEEE